jgi:hypothetical protein
MEDWALIDLYCDKIDWNMFKGNVLYIGTFCSILPRSFILAIVLRKQDRRSRFYLENAPSSPGPCLLQLSPWAAYFVLPDNTVREDEIRS